MWCRSPNWLKMMKTKRLSKCGVLFLLLMACSASRIERALKDADALRGEQKFTEAEASYKSIIARFPGKSGLAKVYLQLGDLYFYNLKKNSEAIAQYDVILRDLPLSPEAAIVYVHLAELYNQDDRYDRAIEMYENLIKYFPNHPDLMKFRHDIGAKYLKMKNYTQARLEFKRVLEAKDVPPEVAAATWYDMGETYFLEGNESQALGYYKKVLELFPKSELVPMAKLQITQCNQELKEVNRGTQMLPWDRKAMIRRGQ